LNDKQFATVGELSTKLKSSKATILRDITKMAARKELKKIHGGAEWISPPQTNNVAQVAKQESKSFVTNDITDTDEHSDVKAKIAKKAAELCTEGEAIIISGGSITHKMGDFLADRNLSILTNSIVMAQILWQKGDSQVSLPGGELHRKLGIITSSYDDDSTSHYHCSKMFIDARGVGELGVMESDPILIRSQQKLRQQAQQLIVLVDSSNLGMRSNFVFVPLSELDVLITDSGAEPELVKQFEDQGVEVIIVALTS
jgi:DeoR family ulaG and ulaABCDEF operon transcriptional repressor